MGLQLSKNEPPQEATHDDYNGDSIGYEEDDCTFESGASAPWSTGAGMALVDIPQSLQGRDPPGADEVTLTPGRVAR